MKHDEKDVENEKDFNEKEQELQRFTRKRTTSQQCESSLNSSQVHSQQSHALFNQIEPDTIECDQESKRVAETVMKMIDVLHVKAAFKGLSSLKTHFIKKEVKIFKDEASKRAFKKIKQLHDRVCFKLIHVSQLSYSKRKKAIASFLFLVQKKSEEIKERAVANESQQRSWLGKDDTSSLTVVTDSVIMTAAIDAFEKRCTATEDASNAFV